MSGDGPIIVRRKRHDEEEDHHGGVWKLAFADFMTAMMAFFLVMWLINSTSKETKAVIVQYFNPIKLVDATSARKGLRETAVGPQGKSADPPAAIDDPADGAVKAADELFAEPMKKLDEIASREAATETLRDPFDRPPKKLSVEAEMDHNAKTDSASSKKSSDPIKSTAEVQKEIERIISHEQHAPRIEVKRTDEGLLVSLTDDAKFAMFDVGSAQPKPQLVRIIGELGKVLATRSGEIELRGYTDARAYTGKKGYDNWRLSSDRAGVVNYMLIRGGMPPERIGKISGFADRQLRNPKDPFSPLNRRIEILLRNPS